MSSRPPVPIDERRFELLPEEERKSQVRPLSARLYVGKWREHRDAAAFLDERMRAHGEGVDTIVRALLLLQDFFELREHMRNGGFPADDHGQLLLAAGLGVTPDQVKP